MDMTIALKAFNEMQQTASMRLNNIPYDITVIYVTYFQMYHHLMQWLSLDKGLSKDLHEIRFVDWGFLKPHYISNKMKYTHYKKNANF